MVGTPGRVIDLLERNAISFKDLQTIVLDESDTMLNMGFQEDVEKIYRFIQDQNEGLVQKIMFSATYPDWVKQIERKFISKDRIFIDMFKKSENQTNLNVKHLAIQCDFKDRITSLGNVVMTYAGKPSSRTIVFCNTKQDCGEIQMNSNLDVELAVLNGDVSQPQREQTMRLFRDGKIQVLVATNVAARGLDIPEVELII